MITIHKSKEPAAWTKMRGTPGYTKYSPIKELRVSLLAEQGNICAYCMRRIPIKDSVLPESSKIEHVLSREEHPERQLDYTNMVLCCPGFINGENHCDKSKERSSVSFLFQNANLQNSISYKTQDGKITSKDATWNDEINDIICLNNDMLKINRRQTLKGVTALIEKKKWKKAELEAKKKEWAEPDNNNMLKPYCGIVIWYLEKKLRQL